MDLLPKQRRLKYFHRKQLLILHPRRNLTSILPRKVKNLADPSKRIKRSTISKNALASSTRSVVN